MMCIEAAHRSVRADLDLNALEVEIADQDGQGISTLLDPAAVVDLLARLLDGLGELLGRDREDVRKAEAQRTIDALRRLGLDQRAIAKRLGVSETLVSGWRRGRAIPNAKRLLQLRRLLRGAVRTD
jgi:Helix-turn-helix